MKKTLYLVVVVFVAACSSPRYTSNFQKSDVQTGYHPVVTNHQAAIQPEELVASISTTPILPVTVIPIELKESYVNMTKAEQKLVRQQLKKQIKTVLKNQKKEMAVHSAKASGMDHDLKLAAIFGAVGVVGLILGSSASFFTIIGGIAMLIGVVFFIKWLIRQ